MLPLVHLTLIRHALAEDGEDDDARPVSKKGLKRFREVALGLEALGLRFDLVLHSPKRRAMETAEQLVFLGGPLSSTPLLAAEPGPALLEALRGESVAVVGHEPHLSALLGWLTSGQVGGGASFAMKKGGVALLEGEPKPGGMRLWALLPPKVFRAR